jgi:hypothetical protein
MPQEQENRTEYTVTEKSFEEGQKLTYDVFKHLTTLSSGSIVLLATFLKDVFKTPQWKFLITIVFSSLIVCLISSVISMIMLADSIQKFGKPGNAGLNIGAYSIIIAIFAFLFGLIALAIFCLRNF